MFAQLVENLVHLKRGQDGFDQHRRANGPARHANVVLREIENVVPQPRFEMALEFRQIEIRPLPAFRNA